MRIAALSLSVLVACGSSGDVAETRTAGTKQAERTAAQLRAPVDPLLDAQGELIGSGVELYGIELPKGLEPKPALTSKDTRVFESKPTVTRERLEAYLGRRVVTATVERDTSRTAFRSATSAAHPESKQRFDVAVSALGTERATVSFIQHVPPPAKPYDVATVQRALRENQE